ncbi:MAG: ribonuclease D [Theionarchaea archaeon]|nr:ribonuclease D [Theionarchaea archaeon]
MDTSGFKNITIYEHDIPKEYADRIHQSKTVAWDIETSGLDWHNDRIGICQLCTPNELIAIIRIDDTLPERLRSVLSDPAVKKIFHHAVFDLKFMSYQWKTIPQNVACTKIASKLLDVEDKNEHSLQSLLKQYLDVVIKKDEQISNWLSVRLTKEQIVYAATDVMYLLPLLEVLESELKSRGLLELAHLCFKHIPVRVQLDTLGYGDIYSY